MRNEVWNVRIVCKKGAHAFVKPDVLRNVDGHLVIPMPEACPTCVGLDHPLFTKSDLRKLRRSLRKVRHPGHFLGGLFLQ